MMKPMKKLVMVASFLYLLCKGLPCFLYFGGTFLAEHGCNLVGFVHDGVGEVLQSRGETSWVVGQRKRHADGHTGVADEHSTMACLVDGSGTLAGVLAIDTEAL